MKLGLLLDSSVRWSANSGRKILVVDHSTSNGPSAIKTWGGMRLASLNRRTGIAGPAGVNMKAQSQHAMRIIMQLRRIIVDAVTKQN